MTDKDIKAKNIVFDKYVVCDNKGRINFKDELKSSIDKKDISTDDAFNIIFELMYGVINYNYNENEVKNELLALIDKIKNYNLNNDTIKKSYSLF